ncbi:PAS domain-containing protein [Rhodothermus profundi]|uniref:PAS domain S-box-containing protein n=1 Tax=Rhodothermus profundi TaxID=633813 RepID=A0A1M6TUR4_9BACT|nr:PAS domain-containing protein [Rhodothermus profundi]SHK60707.1 PAS domain S-box-containing protein [Rhodothermus profundi]
MMQGLNRLVLISNDEALGAQLEAWLPDVGVQVYERFPSLQALLACWHEFEAAPPDVMLVDLDLPDCQGLDAFAEVKVRAINIPVVALIDRSEAVLGPHLLQMGAADYLFRDRVSVSLLEHILQRAWERQRVQNNLSEYLQELYASEARFRAVLRHYPDGLLILDAEGRILMANDEAQRLLECAETHLVGQPLTAFVQEETPGFGRLVGASETVQVRMQLVSCEEDSCRLVLLRPLTATERGEIARDHQTAALSEVILATLDAAVLVADRTGHVVYANRAATVLMGSAPRQLLGRPLNGMFAALMPGACFDRLISWLELQGGTWKGIRQLGDEASAVQTYQVHIQLLAEPLPDAVLIVLQPVSSELTVS